MRESIKERASTPPRALTIACATAFAVGLALRLPGWHRVLWVDEAFTTAFALEPTLRGLIDDCLHELSGPGYYGFAWAWSKIAGASAFALRLPSLLFSLGAPALILWKGHERRDVRLIWAALAVTFYMPIYYATEARAYAMLFFLGTVQAILLRAMIERPRAGLAHAWAATSAFMVLTHYFAAPLVATQGLAYLILGGRRAIRTWPALLWFVPVLGWASIHLPFLARYADPTVAWQPRLNRYMLGGAAREMAGPVTAKVVAVAVVIPGAGVVAGLLRALSTRARAPYRAVDLAVIAASVGAIAIILGYGVLKPSFTARYMLPIIPGVLLCPAVWGARMGARWRWVPIALIGLFVACAIVEPVRKARLHLRDLRENFSWQPAAEAFAAAGVRHVVFLWDSRETAVGKPEAVAKVGGVFFDRAHLPIRTTGAVLANLPGDPDPNLILPAMADASRHGRERDGFIWMYSIGNEARMLAGRHPPRLDLLARDFVCRDYMGIQTVVFGCIRREGR